MARSMVQACICAPQDWTNTVQSFIGTPILRRPTHSTVSFLDIVPSCYSTWATSLLYEVIFLGDTCGCMYKVRTHRVIVRTIHVQVFEDEFPSINRQQHHVCFASEEASTTNTASANSSVEISTSDSWDDDADATGDNSHKENSDLYTDLLTDTPVPRSTHGEREGGEQRC